MPTPHNTCTHKRACLQRVLVPQGSVLTLMKGGEEEVENEAQFTAIMRAFGQSFLQPDIGVFRQNLETLESLNSKLKLYHKVGRGPQMKLCHWVGSLHSKLQLCHRVGR